MNSFLKPVALTIALSFVAFGASVGTTYADPVKDRIAAMKSVGKSMGALAGMFKGKTDFSGSVAESNANNILAQLAKAEGMFAGGKEMQGSRAKATIWSDANGFAAAMVAGKTAAKAVATTGASSDEAAFKTAFAQLGKGCGGCHKVYRLPKE